MAKSEPWVSDLWNYLLLNWRLSSSHSGRAVSWFKPGESSGWEEATRNGVKLFSTKTQGKRRGATKTRSKSAYGWQHIPRRGNTKRGHKYNPRLTSCVGRCSALLWPMWGQRLVEFIQPKVKAWGGMLKVCLIRVRGHHRSFCVSGDVEGVKAARTGSGRKLSSQNRSALHSEEITDLNVCSKHCTLGRWKLQYFLKQVPEQVEVLMAIVRPQAQKFQNISITFWGSEKSSCVYRQW